MQGNAALADPRSLLRVAEAWRNGPALATLFSTFVVVALVGLFCIGYGSSGTLPFAVALGFVLAGFGLTAAGLQFAEQAGGRPISSVTRAFSATPAIAARVVLLAGVLSIALFAFVLAAWAVLFACRLPLVGPILYVIAVPVLTLAGAMLLLATCASALLSLPALWEGHSLRTALSQLWAIGAQRKLEASTNLILFFLVVGLVAVVVSAFVLAGFGLATGLAVRFSAATGVENALALWTGRVSLVGAEAMAVSAATALVFAITGTLLMAVFLFGLATAYLRTTDGIDIAAARAALGRAIVEIQVKRGQAVEDAKRLAQRMRRRTGFARRRAAAPALAAFAPAEATNETASAAVACAYCGSSAAHDDTFCGDCGKRLQPTATSAPPVHA